MSATSELSTNQQYLNKKPTINVVSWMRNQIANLYYTLSAPEAATRDALTDRLQSKRETASTFYNRIMDNIEYGRERFKDIVKK